MDNGRISQAQYEAIRKNVANWPQWKKNYANQHIIISPNTKKI